MLSFQDFIFFLLCLVWFGLVWEAIITYKTVSTRHCEPHFLPNPVHRGEAWALPHLHCNGFGEAGTVFALLPWVKLPGAPGLCSMLLPLFFLSGDGLCFLQNRTVILKIA